MHLQSEQSSITGAWHKEPLAREDAAARLTRYLPQVVAATVAVAVIPLAVGWALASTGALSSAALGSAVALVLSLAASWFGAASWKRRAEGSELLFADLMIWSWVRRWVAERAIARTTGLLAADPAGPPDAARRAALLRRLASDLQARDPYTQSHARRVARYAALIAKRMGLEGQLVAKIQLAATVHDVGKMEVPNAILNKPGALTDDEFAVMRGHVENGVELVTGLGDAQIVAIVRHHHERLDGSGYPDGLTGDAIPLGARIIAVADTFDAITSTRPYRRASSHKKGIDILTAEAGIKLDADAVHAFLQGYAGRRELGLWVVLAQMPRGLLSGLGADLSAAGVAPLQTAIAIVAAAAALSGQIGRPRVAHEPPQQAALSAQPSGAQTSNASGHLDLRPAVVRRPQTRRPAIRPLKAIEPATAARITVAAHTVRTVVVPLQTRPTPGGSGGNRSITAGRPGGGSSAGGKSGPPAGQTGGSGGTGTPGGPAPASPTLVDRVVAVATAVTSRLPAPVGPISTSALNSVARTADRILPVSVRAPMT